MFRGAVPAVPAGSPPALGTVGSAGTEAEPFVTVTSRCLGSARSPVRSSFACTAKQKQRRREGSCLVSAGPAARVEFALFHGCNPPGYREWLLKAQRAVSNLE